MKKSLLVFLVLLFQETKGQNQILIKPGEVVSSTAKKEIIRIKLPWGNLGGKVVAVFKDGTKECFDKKEIWGIKKSDKNENVRFSFGMAFKIIDTSSFILYQTCSPHPVFYFSENLSSKIRVLNRRNLIKTIDIDKLIIAYRESFLVRRLL